MKATLETERCEQLETVIDFTGVLDHLLPSFYDTSYQCLRFIDPYGHTVFNRLQMEVFLAEWERITDLAQTPDEMEILSRIEKLARRCQKEPHFYLKFYGD